MLSFQQSQIKKLAVWMCLNVAIFIASYLNYLFQLKHRYLYRMLNVGLCSSRAAAMVINFNLLLVWIPMCKYSLTRLAFFANASLRRKRHTLSRLVESLNSDERRTTIVRSDLDRQNGSIENHFAPKLRNVASNILLKFRVFICAAEIKSTNGFLIAVDHCRSLHTICASTITIASVIHTVAHLLNVINFSRNFDPFLSNLNMAEYKGQNPFQLLMSVPGLTGSLMILILILMSLSSVDMIRNSSYDLFRIFHRLSIVFVLLLALHPSSHLLKEQTNIDRHNPDLCHNTRNNGSLNLSAPTNLTDPLSYELARVPRSTLNVADVTGRSTQQPRLFHINSPQLSSEKDDISKKNTPISSSSENDSAISKFLATTRHTNGHVNVHENNRQLAATTTTTSSDLNVNRATATRATVPARIMTNQTGDGRDIRNRNSTVFRVKVENSTTPLGGRVISNVTNFTTSISASTTNFDSFTSGAQNNGGRVNFASWQPSSENSSQTRGNTTAITGSENILNGKEPLCLDERPKFVAQKSICLYVLTIGLSCYLVDLLLRKLRRSKSTIELLSARLDSEGNLIELTLNNNHRRFQCWLPGQFVYLNCPQIAAYEWHPFTISSMDNASKQFTLHIKTGGDWTRKLREKLESKRDLLSSLYDNRPRAGGLCPIEQHRATELLACRGDEKIIKSGHMYDSLTLPGLEYDRKPGQPRQIECTSIVRIIDRYEPYGQDIQDIAFDRQPSETRPSYTPYTQVYSICCEPKLIPGSQTNTKEQGSVLDLYIDGPFHSPFERLLEQQVSVCIANGVGWTAFSSVFQHIINNLIISPTQESYSKVDRWSQWCNFSHRFPPSSPGSGGVTQRSSIQKRKLPSQIHLVVIVTTIEQLKPFYYMAQEYFDQILRNGYQISSDVEGAPVKGILAFVTRSDRNSLDVQEFCLKEDLYVPCEPDGPIVVNEIFSVQFGKPNFHEYLASFRDIYFWCEKISVYCCGSFQVKKSVQEICRGLNRTTTDKARKTFDRENKPYYSYHEENF